MASKQLGKLRQWGREVIATKEKTVLTEEFRELEQDVDLRRAGVERLHGACSEYHGYLQKKKEYASVEEGVKMLPVDAMGAVMMSHGEEFGDDSAFGQCLLKFGRAHCKIATLQESYALTFRDTYLANLESSLDELSDYATQRKKLDSRRLAYDAAMTRSSKAKKDKEVKEAEDELSKAKLRYEETSTDVQARMHAIQEKEIEQLRDLTEFLATETRFVEQYLDVLRDTREEWLSESVIQRSDIPRRKASPHAFAFGRSTPSISSTSKTSSSVRPSSASTAGTTPPEDRQDEDEYGLGSKRRPSPASTPRPSSRGSMASTGTAHTSRRRKDSVGAAESDGGGTGSVSKRINVAGWASSAVSSLGRSKKDANKDKTTAKQRDKEAGRAFANLENDGDDSSEDLEHHPDDLGVGRDEGIARSFGSSSFSKSLSRAPSISLRPRSNPLDSSSSSSFNSHSGSMLSTLPKLARALHDFAGASDELSFRTGDEITVISDVKGGWSMGELDGRRGLFPTNYTEDFVVPPRAMTDLAKRAQDTMSEDGMSIISADGQHIGLYDEPFGDHHLAKSPMVMEHDHDVPTDDEDEMQGLFAPLALSSMPDIAPTITPEGLEVGNISGNGVRNVRPPPPPLPQRKQTERKPPPPPPARRSTISASAAPLHVSNSGGPYVSAPSSTSHLPSANFPLPPAAPRRSSSRGRSSNSVSTNFPSTFATSPFDN